LCLADAHLQILVGRGDYRQRAVPGASRWIARLVLIVTCVELGLAIPGVILASIGASVVQLMLARWFVRPSLLRRSRYPARQFLKCAVPLFLFALSMRLFDRLDLFTLKLLGGTAVQAGIYAAALNLAVLPGLLSAAFAPLLLSNLTRTFRAGECLLARTMARNALRVIFGLLPLAGLIAGAAPQIVGTVFGPGYQSAAPILAVLIFGALARLMIAVATAILTAADRAGWTAAITAPLPVLAIAGHLVAIPRWGAVGASVITTLVSCLGAAVALGAVHRRLRVLPPVATVLRSLSLCACAYAAATLCPSPGFWWMVKLSLLSLALPVAFLLLGEFSRVELAALCPGFARPPEAALATDKS
jgi:O-antigen/teichoic acid export membrane protein